MCAWTCSTSVASSSATSSTPQPLQRMRTVCAIARDVTTHAPRGYIGSVDGMVLAVAVHDTLWAGLRDTFLMAYEVWWALVFGFLISAIVQAWVPREGIERALASEGAGPIAKATGLGAASSSCSYSAI